MKRRQQQAGSKQSSKKARKDPPLPLDLANSDAEAKRSGKPGPRMSPAERDLLLKLLVAGEREGAINAVFRSLGYVPPASSALAYYRERWRASIEQAQASHTERALTEGLALRAERVAKLKEHADVLDLYASSRTRTVACGMKERTGKPWPTSPRRWASAGRRRVNRAGKW